MKAEGPFSMSIIGIMLLAILGSCQFEPTNNKWKDGVIPYYLTGRFTAEETADIEKAMDVWEHACDLRFQKTTPRARAYNIIKVHENNWSSSIGANNSVCYMSFGTGGHRLSHIIHELGHAIGLMHEHQRPDRNKFVKIYWDKILPSFRTLYEIMDNPLLEEEQYPYDYSSIMHYPKTSFSIDGSTTMESVDISNPISRQKTITVLDGQKCFDIYGPSVERQGNSR